MLRITIPKNELFDEKTETFIEIPETTLNMEHSLVSLHKWESKWHKPWLSKDEKTLEERLDYYYKMTITQNVNPKVFLALTENNVKEIEEYISDPMTAAIFSDNGKKEHSSEFVTAESIYYAMINNQIPYEYRKWHLNQLLALIRFCNIKNSGDKAPKLGREEIINKYKAINEANRAKFRSKG